MNIEKFSNILGADTVKKVYEDGLSQPVQESGKAITDLIKAFRLFTAPIQLLAAYQDRLARHLKTVHDKVPPERQIEAPASISGPILERLKYLEDDNYLTDLYLSLLEKAIDKEQIPKAHPAFFHIIDQLSPDEAMLLHALTNNHIDFDYTNDLLKNEKGEDYWGPRDVINDTTPKGTFVFIQHFEMYISHLKSLNLVDWSIMKEEPIWDETDTNKEQKGLLTKTKIYLTEFGNLFVDACIPKGKILFQNRF